MADFNKQVVDILKKNAENEEGYLVEKILSDQEDFDRLVALEKDSIFESLTEQNDHLRAIVLGLNATKSAIEDGTPEEKDEALKTLNEIKDHLKSGSNIQPKDLELLSVKVESQLESSEPPKKAVQVKSIDESALGGYLSDISSLLSKSKASFENFDVVSEHNKQTLNEISNKSGHLKYVVDSLEDIRKIEGGSRKDTLIAKDKLSEIISSIKSNERVTEDEKNLLLNQAEILKAGIKSQASAGETLKKTMSDYSDAAVAGFTSILGNSPVLLFLTKIATDQAKAFFARRKARKETRAELIKQEAFDLGQEEHNNKMSDDSSKQIAILEKIADSSGKTNKEKQSSTDKNAGAVADSVKQQQSEEKRREGKGSRLGAKFKSTKHKASGIFGMLFKPLLKMLGMFGGLVTVLGIVKSGFLKVFKVVMSVASIFGGLIKKLLLFRLPSFLGGTPTKLQETGENPLISSNDKGATALPKKAGSKALAKGIGKSILKKIPLVGLLAGIGFGIQRAMSGDFIGASGEVLSGLASTVPGPGTALSAGIDAGLMARDMNKENEPDKKAEQVSRLDENMLGGDIISKDVTRIDTSVGNDMLMKQAKYDMVEKIVNARQAQANNMTSGVRDLRAAENNKQNQSGGSSIIAPSSNTVNNNSTTISTPVRPSNPNSSFIRANNLGAL